MDAKIVQANPSMSGFVTARSYPVVSAYRREGGSRCAFLVLERASSGCFLLCPAPPTCVGVGVFGLGGSDLRYSLTRSSSRPRRDPPRLRDNAEVDRATLPDRGG